jgi:hypothetical protein
MYLTNRHNSINIIKEILNLLGVIVKVTSYHTLLINETLKRKYQYIQSQYFPINTKSLIKNTKEWNDFQLIFECLLNTFTTVNSFSFLEILFPIIREDQNEYIYKIKKVIKSYIDFIITHSHTYSNEIQKVIDIFIDRSNDENLKDNIRFTLMKLIVFKYIKKCAKVNSDIIVDMFIKNFVKLKDIIDESNSNKFLNDANYESKFLMVIEKTIIYEMYTLIFDRINSDVFKNKIHQAIYGSDSKGNEITKFLIGELHNSKRKEIQNWNDIITNIHLNESEKYVLKIENNFYCAAYNCLCSLICLTQSKVEIYNKFLFVTFRDNKEKLFDLLINNRFEYSFPVETNFNIKNISKQTNTNNDVTMNTSSSTTSTSNMLVDNLISDSFFHDTYGHTIKDTLTLEHKEFSLDFLEKIKNGEAFNIINSNRDDSKHNTVHIEDDYVNKHPIMKNMLSFQLKI